MIVIERLTKRFERRTVLDGVSRHASSAARCRRSSARRAAGSRRCSAASTGSRRSTRAPSASATLDVSRPATLQRDPPRGRDGLPAVRPLLAHDRACQRDGGARPRAQALEGEARERAPALLEKVGAARTAATRSRASSRAASSSASRSRARSRWSPKALLLDEPTAALDPERKAEVVKVLEALAKEGTTMVIVTHEPAVVRGIADRAIILKNGQIVAPGASRLRCCAKRTNKVGFAIRGSNEAPRTGYDRA